MADPTREEAEFEDDDEGGGESTVAMQSPSFDSSMPSPVSVPPPPPGPGPVMPTTPLPFTPPAADPRFAGATAQSPAVPPGTSARAKRAQTVIGIAPPGQGAQRPPTPMNPAAPVAAPPPPQRPASVPRVPARPPGDVEPMPETAGAFGAIDAMEKEPPTRAVKVDAATFALDEAAGAAARAATRPSPGRHSPLASTGFAPNGPGPLGAKPAAAPKPLPRPPTMDQENTTTAFVDDLNLVLAAKGSGGLPKLHENEGEDESTRAVPREELLRQDAQLVVGSDAAGEDATLAVPPGMNEAALSGRFPLGADGSGGHPAVPGPSPGFLGSANPTQQSPQFPPMGPPLAGRDMMGPQGGAWGMQGSQTSQMPSSTSAMPMLPPYQQPGAFPPVQGGPMPMPYPPPQDWQPPQQGWQQQGWQPPQPMPGGQMAPAPAKKFPLSTQVIVLGLIGIVCLAIFVTGVVLFFTTKF